jgi:tetratricopeptide (TPR) repeat protein
VIAANADITEEVELGRTLLSQGHLETAQRVLVRVCQEQPDSAQAFRVLAEVLEKRGDGKRAGALVEYADELDAGGTDEIRVPAERVPAETESRKDRRGDQDGLGPKVAPKVAEESAAPPPPIIVPGPPIAAAGPAPSPTPLSLPAPSGPGLSSPGARRARRGVAALILGFLGVAAVVGAVVGYSYHGRSKPALPSAREELDRALVSGALEVLMRARELARVGLGDRRADADDLVRLGLVNALLACDYAVESSKDAEEALGRADGIPAPSSERVALAASARALLALAAGDRDAAQQHAAAAVAAKAPDPPAFALLASARVRTVAGDAEGAAKDLDRALGKGPDLLPIVVDWAASRLDGGDPVVARRTLLAALGKSPDNARARLVLADAERALGEPGWTKRIETACGSDSKISRAIRSLCAVESALQARLEGDRAAAVRKAKAIAQGTGDSMLLGQLSLLLALLGEIDAADEVLHKAEKGAAPTAVSLQWAGFAIQLGRMEPPPASPILDHPAGPDRVLVALRAAHARSGSKGLEAALRGVPPGILDIDRDVQALALLAHEGPPPRAEQLAIEKRGDRSNPVAAYVLGLLAAKSKDFKLAARRLERGLSLHGDACRAATLYLEAFQHLRRGASPNKASLRALRARNARCPIPET